MRGRRAVFGFCVAAALLAGARAHAERETFPSRVAYPPLLQKLKTSGGAIARIVRVRRASDLDALESGHRYKFTLEVHGQLSIAPEPTDAPRNEYVHPILAGGEPVLTAGGIRVERSGEKITGIILDQNSQSYCPSFASLQAAADALARAGVAARLIRREDHPPKCAAR
ncbi:MAG TPA: hypothetical protein VII38_00095 [Polyangia bacterium]